MGKKACVLKRRDDCREGLQNSCVRVGGPGVMWVCDKFALQLTAGGIVSCRLPCHWNGFLLSPDRWRYVSRRDKVVKMAESR